MLFRSESLLHNLRQLPDGRWTWKYDPVLRGPNRRTYPWGDLWPVLAKITCPTLIVRGAESPVLPHEQAARMLEVIPDSRMVAISAAGHTVMGDNPLEFEAKVKPFLVDEATAGSFKVVLDRCCCMMSQPGVNQDSCSRRARV